MYKNVFMLFSTYSGVAQTQVLNYVGTGIVDEKRGQIKTVFYFEKKVCLLVWNKRNTERLVALESLSGYPEILGQTIHLTYCTPSLISTI